MLVKTSARARSSIGLIYLAETSSNQYITAYQHIQSNIRKTDQSIKYNYNTVEKIPAWELGKRRLPEPRGVKSVCVNLRLAASSARTTLLGNGLTVNENLRSVVLLGRLISASGDSLRIISIDLLLFLVFVIATLVLGDAGEDIVGQDTEDEEEPEEIDRLETGEQTERDILTDPALVLLSLPVQFERTDSAELGQDGPEDLQVQEVAQVDPPADEHGEVGRGDDCVEVVQCFGGCQEEIGDVVGDVDGQTHVGEVEAVAQADKRKRDDVVANQFLEVLAGLLELQEQHDRLLGPVACLEEVVSFEEALVLPMGESLEHGGCVEVPDGGALHHEQTEWSEYSKVDGCVHLLHEPRGLSLSTDTTPNSEWTNHLLHDKLARERQHNGVEGHESDILLSLSVHDWATGCLWGLRVREEDGAVHGV